MQTQSIAEIATPTWQRQLAEAVTDPAELLALLALPDHLLDGARAADGAFALRVPRPFLNLMERGNPDDPLLAQVLPRARELDARPGYVTDPLAEESANPRRGLIHKYRGRVLLIASGGCAVNCRYCFRRHFPYQDNQLGQAHWDDLMEYLRADPSIEEVILSGGDPLATTDARLLRILEALEGLPQVRRLRIHTRLPVVIPERLTPTLLERLHTSRLQVVMVVHVNHANELGPDLQRVLGDARAAGITLLNQSVLLRGVNDDVAALGRLSERLFDAGVLPYYLHLLDPVSGAAHFDVDESQARRLVGELATRLPGYLVPRLVREVAGEPAKVPLLPDWRHQAPA